MNTKVILKVDTLKNLVEWLACNICGTKPTYARALYLFANKPDTLFEHDAVGDYSKFDNEDEARKYFEALYQIKFVIESELVDEDDAWRITVTPAANNIDDAFNMYCAEPYNPA